MKKSKTDRSISEKAWLKQFEKEIEARSYKIKPLRMMTTADQEKVIPLLEFIRKSSSKVLNQLSMINLKRAQKPDFERVNNCKGLLDEIEDRLEKDRDVYYLLLPCDMVGARLYGIATLAGGAFVDLEMAEDEGLDNFKYHIVDAANATRQMDHWAESLAFLIKSEMRRDQLKNKK